MFAITLLVGFSVGAFAALGAIVLGKGGEAPWVAAACSLAGGWLIFLLMGSYFTARFQRLVWGKTQVSGLALHCEVSATKFMRIQFMNTLWVVLTLGLYRPFAAIRLARFRLECVSASGLASLNKTVRGAGQSRRGAFGESAAELFDMDVGL